MQIGGSRKSRRISLTPMIDVVFLLLVFFMLAARFGQDMALDVALAGAAAPEAEYSGPPRIVDILPDALRLNGVSIEADALAPRLDQMTESADDTIVLRPREAADLQRVIDVMAALSQAGFSTLVLVE
ncbi:MAG: biopolymer transporter ExbD [Pseudomonadota bacterium]